MTVRFVDTNVLIYAIDSRPEARHKTAVATGLLNEPDLALSVQVLQEFYVQATKTSRPGALSPSLASALIHDWCRFPVQDMTLAILQAALASALRYQLSYWDAAIIEAARALGCRTVLSEDLQDGQDFAGVRVVNPFR